MKATTVFVFALTAASVCAQPIVMPREYYYAGVPRAVADLEARGWSVNWHKVGDFAKGAAKIGADILSKRMDEDELYARGFIDKEDLVTRDFGDDYLEARGWPHINLHHINWHKVGNVAKDVAKIGADILSKRMDEDELYARGFIDKEDLVTRDFGDDYLEARGWPHINLHHINWHKVGNVAKDVAKIGADILSKRMDEDELYARGFIDKEDLVTRDLDDDYLEARGWPHIDLHHINWHKVGNIAKDAAKIGADILFKRMDEDELYARGFIDNEDLVTRDFDDDGDARHPHRLSRHGANHKKVLGKYGKSWAAKGTVHRGYVARRPSRPAGNLDDLN
ncbi:hypothetical protein JOM56_005049 [Amanita muscaria]